MRKEDETPVGAPATRAWVRVEGVGGRDEPAQRLAERGPNEERQRRRQGWRQPSAENCAQLAYWAAAAEEGDGSEGGDFGVGDI